MLIGIAILGCKSSQDSSESRDVLYQYSTLGSLLAGVYDGDITYDEIRQHGDFGLGTFNALDGEMIEIDHQVYQIKADGIAYQVDDEMKAPFAVVTYFEPDQTVLLDETKDYDQLKEYLDSLLPTENIPYAIMLDGTFSYIKTRSVPRQQRPYPRLLDVLEGQPIFEFNQIAGVIVGFRLPDYMDGANAAGYHFHFITDDRNAGGHVLECQTQDVRIEIDYTDEWYTVLPADDNFYGVDMSDDEYQ
ncbi:MAG: acetolactate decarboxylase [Chloroflexi bacterium]|nr:acetolactate decarboxylase [Chloroflexota bacterium]